MSDLELLDRVLASATLASDVFFAGEPCGDWRIGNADARRAGAAFHLVLQGSPWLHVPGANREGRPLCPGDFVFLARDALHVLTSSARSPPGSDTAVEVTRPAGDRDEQIALICGRLMLERHARQFLLAPLPEILVMPHRGASVSAIVPAVVSIMWDEVRGNDRPLSATLNRLADVLVMQVLRYAVHSQLVSTGVFAGLADPQLRRALSGIIAAPGQGWSVETLARQALMSRSAFASRFLSVVGSTPLDFVRDWRMQQAVGLLRAGQSVGAVAAASGYESEASFAKAFKRVIGVGPGSIRPRA